MESCVYGLGLIVFTVILHAASVAFIALAQQKVWAHLEKYEGKFQHGFRNWIVMSAALGLSLAALHGIETLAWSVIYWWTGALDSLSDAIFFSIDSMTTRGASGLTLKQDWRMMGALEGADGMLLFGISTAFIFAMMQTYWQKLMAKHHGKRDLSQSQSGVEEA
jgi:hypothetical protein